jgi:hypothetical protein
MRIRLLVASVLLALPPSSPAWAQPARNLSGVWQVAAQSKPAPGLGAQVTIWHQGDMLTITRTMAGQVVPIQHRLDGSETRSRTPGRLCEGDSEAVWKAAPSDEGLTVTLVGVVPPAGGALVRLDTQVTLRREADGTLSVLTATRTGSGQLARTAVATYRRSAAAPSEIPAAPETTPAPVQASIAQLNWLAGTWIGGTTTTFEERWTPPAGGSMLAVARTLRSGSMSAFEFLCIVQRRGGLVYTAMPNGRTPPTDFTLTAIDASSATFENPAHDFPKRIRYNLRTDGSLEATISGDANSRPQLFVFRREK